MNFVGYVEFALWCVAALAGGSAFAAHRFDAGWVAKKLGWLGFVLFIAAALVWMAALRWAWPSDVEAWADGTGEDGEASQ